MYIRATIYFYYYQIVCKTQLSYAVKHDNIFRRTFLYDHIVRVQSNNRFIGRDNEKMQ